jgi:hypothetical protein
VGVHPYAMLPYANTLSHVGSPLWVSAWQTYVIVRRWHASIDAIGPYPLTFIADGANLEAGMDELRNSGVVTITGVVDGLVGPTPVQLRDAFPVVRPFKAHYLVDRIADDYVPSRHHAYEIRRAARRGVEVELVSLHDIMDEWSILYDELIVRHGINGSPRFSRASFEALAECEGLVAFGGYVDDALVSCHLWFHYRHFAWSHLAATNATGYSAGAAYAVYDHAIRYFADRVINLGGAAGNADVREGGLAVFKSGFSNRQQTCHLIGKVLDPARYEALCSFAGADARAEYFPSYRDPDVTGQCNEHRR